MLSVSSVCLLAARRCPSCRHRSSPLVVSLIAPLVVSGDGERLMLAPSLALPLGDYAYLLLAHSMIMYYTY